MVETNSLLSYADVVTVKLEVVFGRHPSIEVGKAAFSTGDSTKNRPPTAIHKTKAVVNSCPTIAPFSSKEFCFYKSQSVTARPIRLGY